MKKMIYTAAAVFLLTGCARKTATDSIMESVDQQIVALEKTLPAECKTAAIDAQIAAIRATNKSVVETCKADIKAISAARDKWMVAFFAIVAAFGLLILKKVLKYV